ncbi:unnamed protein product [Periconia digitata]|uniref:Uncharacterized protein n=1 Tax=Periconia digitata TaxID=1303443 RepID=A0A9W4UK26_9PLEO|nr:unnamed protein product [Periconia digitata]
MHALGGEPLVSSLEWSNKAVILHVLKGLKMKVRLCFVKSVVLSASTRRAVTFPPSTTPPSFLHLLSPITTATSVAYKSQEPKLPSYLRVVAMPVPPAAPASSHAHKPHARNVETPVYVIVILAITLIIYCFWLGTVIARIWYYGGRVHGDFQVYDIRPEYARERTAPDAAATAAHRESSDAVVDRNRMVAQARPDVNEDEVDDPEEKKRIREEKRISRLPAFLQDDCGDATEFPGVPYGIPMNVFNKRFQVGFRELGLSKVADGEWLAVDKNFSIHATARKELLDRKLNGCIQYLTGSHEEPSEELLPEVVSYLTEHFPGTFRERERIAYRVVQNHSTDEEWMLKRPYIPEAIEILARLANEDFVFFKRDSFTGRWQLYGGAVCLPSGWNLREILGANVDQLENTVISWNSKSPKLSIMGDVLTMYLDLTAILDYVEQGEDKEAMKRSTMFMQTDPGDRRLPDIFFIQAPHDFFPGDANTLNPGDMIVRREMQMFRVLAKSKCIVMTVKTELNYLTDLEARARDELAKEIRGWPKEMASRKGKGLWKRVVLGYLEGKAMMRDDGTAVDANDFTDSDSD